MDSSVAAGVDLDLVRLRALRGKIKAVVADSSAREDAAHNNVLGQVTKRQYRSHVQSRQQLDCLRADANDHGEQLAAASAWARARERNANYHMQKKGFQHLLREIQESTLALQKSKGSLRKQPRFQELLAERTFNAPILTSAE